MSGAFQLVLPGFEGTADELLEGVRRRRVAAESLELSAVTSQILDRLDVVTADLDQTGELAAHVSRLILLKASALLVRPVDDDEESDVAHAERSPAWVAPSMYLAGRQGLESFPAAEKTAFIDRPQEVRSPQVLVEAFRRLSGRSEPKTTVRAPSFASLEITVSRLLRRLGRGTVRLAGLLRGADRMTAVTHFLAVLELVRSGRAAAGQDDLFGDIAIEGKPVDDQRAAAV